MKKTKLFLEAAIVITVALALIMPGSAVITNTTTSNEKNMSYESYHTTLSAINKVQPNPAPLSRGEDVLVSWDNLDEDDEKPKIIANSDGVIVVTYEKKVDMLSRVIPLTY